MFTLGSQCPIVRRRVSVPQYAGGIGLVLATLFLSGCTRGGSSSSPPVPITAMPTTKPTTAPTTAPSSLHIYVSNGYTPSGGLLSFLANGIETTPTIQQLLNTSPGAIAVDSTGKLYLANKSTAGPGIYASTITTYLPNGARATPTITLPTTVPSSIAVDNNGKVYIVAVGGSDAVAVTTYLQNGSKTTPTIKFGNASPYGSVPSAVAVDKNGKIYVGSTLATGRSFVTTYNPDGTQTTPTISTNEASISAIAVDNNGKIYVGCESCANIITFTASGASTTPRITGSVAPTSVAVDSVGKIYATDGNYGDVRTFTATGTPTIPSITATSLNTALLPPGNPGFLNAIDVVVQ